MGALYKLQYDIRNHNAFLFPQIHNSVEDSLRKTIIPLKGSHCSLIGWPCSGVRPLSVRRSPQFQRSPSLKPHGQSKLNFTWNILRKGERKFIFGLGHMIMIVAMAIEKIKK